MQCLNALCPLARPFFLSYRITYQPRQMRLCLPLWPRLPPETLEPKTRQLLPDLQMSITAGSFLPQPPHCTCCSVYQKDRWLLYGSGCPWLPKCSDEPDVPIRRKLQHVSGHTGRAVPILYFPHYSCQLPLLQTPLF